MPPTERSSRPGTRESKKAAINTIDGKADGKKGDHKPAKAKKGDRGGADGETEREKKARLDKCAKILADAEQATIREAKMVCGGPEMSMKVLQSATNLRPGMQFSDLKLDDSPALLYGTAKTYYQIPPHQAPFFDQTAPGRRLALYPGKMAAECASTDGTVKTSKAMSAAKQFAKNLNTSGMAFGSFMSLTPSHVGIDLNLKWSNANGKVARNKGASASSLDLQKSVADVFCGGTGSIDQLSTSVNVLAPLPEDDPDVSLARQEISDRRSRDDADLRDHIDKGKEGFIDGMCCVLGVNGGDPKIFLAVLEFLKKPMKDREYVLFFEIGMMKLLDQGQQMVSCT